MHLRIQFPLSLAFLPLFWLASSLTAAGETLSAVPLVEALQNSELASDQPAQAREAVLALLLNQPQSAPEQERVFEQLAEIARHRETRLGRLFFGALAATPAVENVPDTAARVELITTRPLALGASARVHLEWQRTGAGWKVRRFEVSLLGAAASPVAKAPPYFGQGSLPPILLDADELDYLVGRNPAERNNPDAEFDFNTALQGYLLNEAGAYAAVIAKLRQEVTPAASRAERMRVLAAHVTPGQLQAIQAADADAALRDALWKSIFRWLEGADSQPFPDSMPTRTGSWARVTATDADGRLVGRAEAQRLTDDRIAPRIETAEAQHGRQSNPG